MSNKIRKKLIIRIKNEKEIKRGKEKMKKRLLKLGILALVAITLSITVATTFKVSTLTVEAATKKGWVKTGKTFYYYKNGKKVKGWRTISKKIFYFDKKGKAVTGWKKLNGNYVYFKNTGKKGVKGRLLVKWQTINGKRYYFKKSGSNGSKTKKLTGWQVISKKTYYFNTSKSKTGGYAYVNGTFTIGKEKCTFDKKGVLIKRVSTAKPTPKPTTKPTPKPTTKPIPKPTTKPIPKPTTKPAIGWFYSKTNHGTYYLDAEGVAWKGWLTLSGSKYYFYESGIMARGITKVNGQHFYFDFESGKQRTGLIQTGTDSYMSFSGSNGKVETGLKTIGNKLYYFSTEKVTEGVALSGLQTIGGETYYFDLKTKQAVKGFVESGDSTYYMGADYKMQKGLQQIGGGLYYFGTLGPLSTGLKYLNDVAYCFDEESGKAISGWYTSDYEEVFYFAPTTFKAVAGVQKIDGDTYYFTQSGKLRTGLITDKEKYYFAEPGEAKEGFITIEGKTYYVNEQRIRLTGKQIIDGELYYFNDNGVMLVGLQNIDGKRYYFDIVEGNAITGFVRYTNGSTYYFDGGNGGLTGLQNIDGDIYYLSSTSVVQYGRHLIDGKYYIFDTQTGQAISGWQECTINSGAVFKAYLDPTTYQAVTGLQMIDGDLYYFSAAGWMQIGRFNHENKRYYFDDVSGAAYTGWYEYNGSIYYYNGSNGRFEGAESKEIDGKTYYFNAYGELRINTIPAGEAIPNQAPNANTWETIGGRRYYYDSYGEPVKGMVIINQVLFSFDENGALVTGFVENAGKTYYFTENGAAVGIQEIEGDQYYFNAIDYSMKFGLCNIDGRKCFFDSDGRMKTGWIEAMPNRWGYFSGIGDLLTGLQEIEGNTYWFTSDGIMTTGAKTVIDQSGQQRVCYFDENGIMRKGLVNTESGIYYYNEQSGALETGWKTLNNKKYYFNLVTGAATIGLRNIDGRHYYFNQNTGVQELGLKKYNGKIYHFIDANNTDGLSRGWVTIGGQKYYFNEFGVARTGYHFIEEGKYYFDLDTGASIGGIHWAKSDSAYAFKAGGGCNTGLIEVDGKEYYFYPESDKMAIGLVSIGNTLYYFDADAGKLRNTTVEVAGVVYKIRADGSVVAEGDSTIAKLVNAGIAKLGMSYGDEPIEGEKEPAGYSCSSFVAAAFAGVGIDVTKTAYLQYYSLMHDEYGAKLVASIDDAKPGDIIYLSTVECKYGAACTFWNEIHHVMIYLGNGKVMQSTEGAGSGRSGVVIQDWSETAAGFIYSIVRLNGI